MLTAADKKKLRGWVQAHGGRLRMARVDRLYTDAHWIRLLSTDDGRHIGSIGTTAGFKWGDQNDPRYIAAQARFEARWNQTQQIIVEESAALAQADAADAGGAGDEGGPGMTHPATQSTPAHPRTPDRS